MGSSAFANSKYVSKLNDQLNIFKGPLIFSECLEKTPHGVSTEAMQRQEGIGRKAGPRITPDPRRVQEGDHKPITSNRLLPLSSLHHHLTNHVEEIQ